MRLHLKVLRYSKASAGTVFYLLCFLNLYSEAIFKEGVSDTETGIKVNGRPINNRRYADDSVILADCKIDQEIINRINEVSNNYRLKININKTKFMVFQTTERVSKMRYLGCWLNEKWDPDEKIKINILILPETHFFKRKI